MASQLIPEERVQFLNDDDPATDGRFVLYWMQNAQRSQDNHALEYAVRLANERSQPLFVVFGLTDDYPDANLRHYRFMLEGLAETREALGRRGIPFEILYGEPDRVALQVGKDASVIVTDRGYMRPQRGWRRRVASEAGRQVIQVETDVVVPIESVSDKAEYAARTIRPKIKRRLDDFLVELRTTPLEQDSGSVQVDTGPLKRLDLEDLDGLLSELDLDDSVGSVEQHFEGGTRNARRIWRRFLAEKFDDYAEHRNQPQTNDVSHMSKYLHFGQISPLFLVLEVLNGQTGSEEDRKSFVEELVVQRELRFNFVFYRPDDYDRYSCLPDWAAKTLAEHRDDERPHPYSRAEMEAAETHDEYWNAAMREMLATGYMHNYMRMYWGKKILEWSNTPEEAYETTLYLNNRYFLDGRDPNSFGNVGWIFGLHDRPWKEREIFGKVRYMSAAGLKRKADMEGYIEKVKRLESVGL